MSEQKMREALELADAALSGANMNMNVVERKVKAALAQQPAAVPVKMQIPPAPLPMEDVIYAEGWNACCDEFFGGVEPPKALIIEVSRYQPVAGVELTDEEIEVIDFGICGIREFPIAFARRIIAAHIAKQSGERTC